MPISSAFKCFLKCFHCRSPGSKEGALRLLAMAIEAQLMVQCVGAVVVYSAARMCHAAFVASIDVWYSSPANRHVYFKAFKEKSLCRKELLFLSLRYNKTGKVDYSALMRRFGERVCEKQPVSEPVSVCEDPSRDHLRDVWKRSNL